MMHTNLTFDYRILRNEHSSLCPVSLLLNSNNDGILGYPIELYDPSLSFMKDDLFTCKSTETKDIYHCSEKSKCPVIKQHIDDASSNIPNQQSLHSLCKFKENIGRSNPNTKSKVIILGGSMTIGTKAEGCCCSASLDQKCSHIPNMDYGCKVKWVSGVVTVCSWISYFQRWLDKISSNNIEFINLAHGGWTSPYSAQNLISEFTRTGIDKLTSDDVILIDHSINDGECLTDSSYRRDTLQSGLQNLIHMILSSSEEHSWPTIILLETWPYPDIQRHARMKNDPPDLYDYRFSYYNVVEAYKIPLWSYRDVLWSSSMQDSKEKYIDHMKFLAGIHPPWFFHLYLADFTASLLLQEFDNCNKRINRSRKQKDMTKGKILPLNNSITQYCSIGVPKQLEISGISQKPHSIKFQSYPKKAWTFKIDSGKYGWITSDTSIGIHVKDNFCEDSKHDVVSYSSTLVFNIDESIDFSSKSYLLRMHYFKTYLNAGVTDVFLCGKYLATLDALWDDWYQYKFSFNEIYTVEYNPMKKGSIKYCTKDEPRVIELKHLCNTDKFNRHNFTRNDYLKARGMQKFKFIAFDICEKNE